MESVWVQEILTQVRMKESHEEHCLKVILVQHLRSGEGPVVFIFESTGHTITQVSNQIVCSCHTDPLTIGTC